MAPNICITLKTGPTIVENKKKITKLFLSAQIFVFSNYNVEKQRRDFLLLFYFILFYFFVADDKGIYRLSTNKMQ